MCGPQVPSSDGPAADVKDGSRGAMRDACPMQDACRPLHGPSNDTVLAPPLGSGTAIET